MNRRGIITAAVAAIVLSVGVVAGPAHAGDGLDELVALNPGTTREGVEQLVRDVAAQTGSTPAAVADQMLAEARESVAASGSSSGRATSNDAVPSGSGGGGGTTILKNGERRGDIFVSPSSTLFVNHGHTGIYYTTRTIVEAPGLGKKSRSASASTLPVGRGAVKQYVKTSQTNRTAAATYAYTNLRGKAYNANFAFNKDRHGAKMNCSQLVWAAYIIKTRLDLDGNGGLGVYPYNIKDSKYTVTYRTL
ncbi:hypothetical protein [Microbacterium sp.]|uniref:hypothetical protein n=1 Tax=Microbacterium sp. TaxID=51671 RepID=UPI003A88C455